MHRTHAVLAAALAAATPSFAQTAGISQLGPPPAPSCSNCLAAPAHTVFLDASGGKVMFPLPSGQRNFASVSEFATFIQQNLYGVPLWDGAGNVVGVSGNLLQIGRTYYLDANNAIQPITDPIGAFIGGIPGQFTVAGVTFPTGLQGQTSFDGPPVFSQPQNVLQCKQNPVECIAGHSWNNHAVGHLHDSVGIEVDQVLGGYQESTYFCWNGPCPFCVPWICTSHSGTNVLSLSGSLFIDLYLLNGVGPSTTTPWDTISQSVQNQPHLKLESYQYCFGACSGNTEAGAMVGACAQDSSQAIPSIGATADGRTLGCAIPGVTCSSGLTLCQPNNVCTTLSTDVNNCGTCGNVCTSGYSCQGGSCIPPPPPPPPACTYPRHLCDGFCVSASQSCN